MSTPSGPQRREPLPPLCRERFEHVRDLAEGGFGSVVLARQRRLDRQVVIKVLHAEVLTKADDVARFINEARITASLSHPNIVVLIDHDVEDGVPWIAYEYLAGRDLRSRLDAGAMSPEEAAVAMAQVCLALEEAHRHGILHRDIKPENVLLVGTDHYKVTDFGIAKWIEASSVRTCTGIILGTPAYIAPELIRGDAPTPASDQYAAGIMLHELLTGARPFQNDNLAIVLQQHLDQLPRPPSLLSPAVPPALDDIVLRALAKDPAARFDSALAMARALEAVFAAAPAAPRAPASPASRAPRRSASAKTSVVSRARPPSGATAPISIGEAGAGDLPAGRRRVAARPVAAALLAAVAIATLVLLSVRPDRIPELPSSPIPETSASPDRSPAIASPSALPPRASAPAPEPADPLEARKKRLESEKKEGGTARVNLELAETYRDLRAWDRALKECRIILLRTKGVTSAEHGKAADLCLEVARHWTSFMAGSALLRLRLSVLRPGLLLEDECRAVAADWEAAKASILSFEKERKRGARPQELSAGVERMLDACRDVDHKAMRFSGPAMKLADTRGLVAEIHQLVAADRRDKALALAWTAVEGRSDREHFLALATVLSCVAPADCKKLLEEPVDGLIPGVFLSLGQDRWRRDLVADRDQGRLPAQPLDIAFRVGICDELAFAYERLGMAEPARFHREFCVESLAAYRATLKGQTNLDLETTVREVRLLHGLGRDTEGDQLLATVWAQSKARSGPEYPALALRAAEMHRDHGRWDRAERWFDEGAAAGHAPAKDGLCVFLLAGADRSLHSKEPEAARVALEKCAGLLAQASDMILGRRHDLARWVSDRARRLSPEIAARIKEKLLAVYGTEPSLRLAEFEAASGNLTRAGQILTALPPARADADADTRLVEVRVLARVGRWSEAITAMKEVARNFPGHGGSWQELAFLPGAPMEKRIEVTRAWAEGDPENIEAHLQLARVLRDAKSPEFAAEAERTLRAIVHRWPHEESGYRWLAYFLIDSERTGEAFVVIAHGLREAGDKTPLRTLEAELKAGSRKSGP